VTTKADEADLQKMTLRIWKRQKKQQWLNAIHNVRANHDAGEEA